MRKAVITRTVNFTRCAVMAINTESKEVTTIVLDYTGNSKDNNKRLEELKKAYQGEEVLVQITDTQDIEQLYAMYEDDFIRYATPISDRTQRPNSLS